MMKEDGYVFNLGRLETNCRHLCKDRLGSFCSKDLSLMAQNSGKISDERRKIILANRAEHCKKSPSTCPLYYSDARKYFGESRISEVK